MNKKLIKFERKKFLKEKKNLFLFLVIGLFLVALFIQTTVQQKEAKKKDIRQTIALYHTTTQSILTLAGNQTLTKEEQAQLELLSTIAENLDTVASLKKEDHYIESYPYQLNAYKQIQTLEKDYGVVLVEAKIIKKQGDRLQVLQENKIEESFNETGTTGFLFLLTFLKQSFSLFGMIVLLLLFMDLWSEEKNAGGTILYTLPIKRREITNTKFYLAISISVWILLITSVCAFLIGTFYSGLGSINFPIVGIIDNQTVILSLKSYLIKGFLLGILGVFLFILCIKVADALFSQATIIFSSLFLLLGVSFGVEQLYQGSYLPLNLIESWSFLSLHSDTCSFILAITIQLFTFICLLKISDHLSKKR